MRFKLLYIVLFVLSGTSLYAHGDLHKRIVKISEEIKKYPDSAYLYFKRGELYYQHNNFTNSLTDFKYSKKLGLDSFEQNHLLAKSYYHLHKYSNCRRIIKKILKDDSDNIHALKLLADMYFKKKKYEKSAQLYNEVVQKSDVVLPEYYLYASKAWFATDTEYGQQRSQKILIQGIEDLGDIIVLYNKLISNYIDMQDFDSAAKFQTKVIEISNRKERAYLKLANIQIEQEKFKEARFCIARAEESYRKLPYRLRNTKFMKEFYSELQSKRNELEKIEKI